MSRPVAIAVAAAIIALGSLAVPTPTVRAQTAGAKIDSPGKGRARAGRHRGKRARGKRPGPAPAQPPAGQRPAWLAGAPPTGWIENPGLSRSVGTALGQSSPFGDLRGRAGAIAYVERGVGAFYLSWFESGHPAPEPSEAVRGALDELRESRLVSSPEAHSTEELAYAETVADGMVESRLEWRHVSNETMSLVESALWVSGDGMPRMAKAECVVATAGGAVAPAVDRSCRAALATFGVNVAPADRVALSALPPSRVGIGTAPRLALGSGGGESSGRLSVGGPPTIGPAPTGAGERVLYRGPPSEETGRGVNRWLVGAGLGLLVVAVLMTLRARRSREPEGEPGASDALPDEVDAEAEEEAGLEPGEAGDPATEPNGEKNR